MPKSKFTTEEIPIRLFAKKHRVTKQAITESIREKQRGRNKGGVLFEFRSKLYFARKVGNLYLIQKRK